AFLLSLFFFIVLSTAALYTLSLHDALPIFGAYLSFFDYNMTPFRPLADKIDERQFVENDVYNSNNHDVIQSRARTAMFALNALRSEEHTSELQSRENLVCRLLLEKKKKHHI